MYDEAEAEKRGAAYKYGLVIPFLRKFPFEDQEHVPNSAYYSSDDDEENWHPNAHEVVKRFLKQVRESNGYDVDCCPPPRFGKINAETGKTYELVQVDKAIHTSCTLLFLTFTVKEADADEGSPKTIRAMVNVPYCNDNFALVEWMFKPLPPAAEYREKNGKIWRGHKQINQLWHVYSLCWMTNLPSNYHFRAKAAVMLGLH